MRPRAQAKSWFRNLFAVARPSKRIGVPPSLGERRIVEVKQFGNGPLPNWIFSRGRVIGIRGVRGWDTRSQTVVDIFRLLRRHGGILQVRAAGW
jgi:hypothetical protein